MWPYQSVTRQQLEEKKDLVERLLQKLGAVPTGLGLPHPVSGYGPGMGETFLSQRTVFRCGKVFVRVDEVLFPEKPFLVLGAYGCGVFRNDPEKIAAWWQELLEEGLGDCFDSVFHAVLDRSKNQACIRAFEEICGLGTYPIGVPTSMRFPSGS